MESLHMFELKLVKSGLFLRPIFNLVYVHHYFNHMDRLFKMFYVTQVCTNNDVHYIRVIPNKVTESVI